MLLSRDLAYLLLTTVSLLKVTLHKSKDGKTQPLAAPRACTPCMPDTCMLYLDSKLLPLVYDASSVYSFLDLIVSVLVITRGQGTTALAQGARRGAMDSPQKDETGCKILRCK